MQFIKGQANVCYPYTMPYSYDRWLEIFYMHYQIDMTIHDTACDKQVGVNDSITGLKELSCTILERITTAMPAGDREVAQR